METEKKDKFFKNGFGGIHGVDVASPLGRAAFLFLAKKNTKFKPEKYGLALLIDKTDKEQIAQLKVIQAQCKELVTALWGDKAEENLKKIKYPMFVNGDEKSNLQGYAGHWVINAKNEFGPGHAQGFKILNKDMEPDSFEAGMIIRCTLQPGVGPDGFFYKLRAIKKVKDDGVRFAGGPDAASVIDHLDEAVQAVNAGDASSVNVL